jgi:hypothetical protein
MPGTELAIGVFVRNDLTNVLSLLHVQGAGQTARVFDPARGEIMGQLRRAGLTADLGFLPLGADDVVVLVRSAGQAAQIGELMLRARAKDVRIVPRPESPASAPAPGAVAAESAPAPAPIEREPPSEMGDSAS